MMRPRNLALLVWIYTLACFAGGSYVGYAYARRACPSQPIVSAECALTSAWSAGRCCVQSVFKNGELWILPLVDRTKPQ